MHDAWELYQARGAQALWDRCLGFLDLSIEETAARQERLVLEQLRMLAPTELGRRLIGGVAPTSVAEFRERVPFTSYEDYEDTLGQRREDVTPEPPRVWMRTSGRSLGQPKWIPIAPKPFEEMMWTFFGAVLAATTSERGAVRLRRDARVFNMTAPPPYASGTATNALTDLWPMRMHPPVGPATDQLSFEQRMGTAFSGAVTHGVDLVLSMAAVLAALGEGFADRRPPGSALSRLKNGRAAARMGRAALTARIAGRKMLPRDAWRLQGVICGGMDSSLFRERIRAAWGHYPLEIFVSTEGMIIGMQAWDKTGLTFVPHLNFYEFIAEDQLVREAADPGYRPRSALLHELEAGRNYELVISNLLGGPMVRYRTGDILRITALANQRAGIALPQFVHYSRRTDLLEVAGFVRLNERTVWQAIEDARVPYVDWTVRKEVDGDSPVIHLRIEPRPGTALATDEAEERIHRALSALDPNWGDMEAMAGLRPLRVTFLPEGSFERYAEHRRQLGSDLGQMKPLHMNPSEKAMDTLLELAGARRED